MRLRDRFTVLILCALVCLLTVFAAVPARCQEGRLKLTSPALGYFANLPLRYTCVGLDVSPPLGWINVPAGCKSLALVLTNEDDSTVHWLVYNIDPGLKGLPEDADVSALGAAVGQNDSGTLGYEGPCLTDGKAKFSIVLYALREPITLKAGSDKRFFYDAVERLVIEDYTFVFFSGTPRER